MKAQTFIPAPWFVRPHLVARWREIASALARHGLGWFLAEIGSDNLIRFERGRLGHPRRDAPYGRAEHWRMALGDLGATFIKLGQMLSTRADLLPEDYITELAKLQDDAPAVPFDQVCQIVCEEIGKPPNEIFAEFSPEPLASASIGQVHTGVLKDGHKVVVKVQRPGVRALVEQDLEILRGLVEWIEAHTEFGRQYRPTALLDEFAYTLRSELDYRREGQNAERFRRNFAGEPALHVPLVHWDFTTGRVLTMERVSGIKISDLASLDAAGIDRRTVAQNAVRIMLKEVFEFGFFHADPHPGNFFVRPDASIALIDFGMIGRIAGTLKSGMLNVCLAVASRDAERMTDAFFDLGVAAKGVRRNALLRDLSQFLDDYAGSSVEELAGAHVTSEIMRIAYHHKLQLPGELVMLLRLIGMSEGLGARLDPEFRLFDFAAPYLTRIWREQRAPDILAKRLGLTMLDAVELGMQLPRRTTRLLDRLERGELEFNVRAGDLREALGQLQRMTNRLALSILVAATVLALGLLMLIYHPPGWEQYAGYVFALAFLLSLGLGALLIWRIWRSGGQ